jgi:prepilin signal peptidase PulO-like enzyme (type II secretory pathway)
MTNLEISLLFVLGLLWGSFLNVVILRYNTGRSFVSGRSVCFSCGKVLGVSELIPFFSYFFQGGKCLSCRSSISIQYPLVEFLSALTFLLAGGLFNPFYLVNLPYFLFIVFIFSLLLAISVYDTKHKIIPDVFVYTFITVSFFYKIFTSWKEGGDIILSSIIPDIFTALLSFFFFFLFWFLSRGRAMGFGDAKLAAGLGIFLGPYNAFLAILYSFWAGAIVSVGLLFFKGRSFTIKSEIPFGPFLVTGAALIFFFGIDVFLIF